MERVIVNRFLPTVLPVLSIALLACGGAPSSSLPVPDARQVRAGEPAHACQEGSADCDGDRTNGCETAVDFSEQHCGRCGETCGGDARCVFGICRRTGIL